MKTRNGFTLIELLMVIAILGVLSAVIIGGLRSARIKARDATRMSDVYHYQLLLNACAIDNGAYPDCTDGGFCDVTTANYHFIASCGCWGGQFQQTILNGCAPITPTQLPNDPVNSAPLSYYLYYFEPGFANVNPACRGKYVFMANLESSAAPGIRCSTNPAQVPNAGPRSYWAILGS